MMNLKTLLIRPLKVIPKKIVVAVLVISFLGLLDASYLTAKHYSGSPINCSILEGCEQVTTSQYSTIFGIPIALGGAVYYLMIFVLSFLYLDTKNSKFFSVIPTLATIGFLASLGLVYLQIFVIKAICIYCMGSAVTSTILFILSVLIIKKNARGSIT